LELILTNTDFINDVDHLSPLGKGDHEILTFNCNTSNISTSSTHKRNYNKGNYDALRNHLDVDWESILLPHKDNIEQMWNIFTPLLRSGTELHIPQHNSFHDWKKTFMVFTFTALCQGHHKEKTQIMDQIHRNW